MSKTSARSKGYQKTPKKKTSGYTPREIKIMIAGFLVILIGFLCALYLPDFIESFHLLKVEAETVQGVEENWLVGNVGSTSKKKYRKIGEVESIEGYALTGSDSFGDANVRYLIYEPVDSGAAEQIIVQVANGKAETLINDYTTNISKYGAELLYASDIQQETIDDKEIYCLLTEYRMRSNDDDDNPTYDYTQSAIIYTPSLVNEKCVVLSAMNSGDSDAVFADRDGMLELAKRAIASVTLSK